MSRLDTHRRLIEHDLFWNNWTPQATPSPEPREVAYVVVFEETDSGWGFRLEPPRAS